MPLKAGSCLLGIDLGTSSIKALVVTRDGATVASASAEYPVLRPQPDQAEQNPADWRQAVQDAVRGALKGSDPHTIAAIGLSGQMHGTVLLDARGDLLSSAIIWPDQRSRDEVEWLTQTIGRERLVTLAGSPVATGFQAATLLWLRRHRPEVWARLALALTPKDWLRHWLTEEVATDPSDASGALLLDTQRRDWSLEILGAVGLRRDQLPPVRPSKALAGALTESAAQAFGLPAGTPVVVGAADAACSLLGAGAVEPGTVVVNLSTGGQVVLPVPTPRVDTGGRIHTFCSALEPGGAGAGWYNMGATLCVGMALAWLRRQVLGWESDAYERMTELAGEVDAGAGGLLFLPYLTGERTPHMDPRARGLFLGLTAAHGQGHLVRAVLEGATFACYDAYQVLLSVGGAPRQVLLAGGGSRSALWQQIVADVFGVPVRRLLVMEQSALGAALLAGAGIGLFDAAATAPLWTRWGEPVDPRPAQHEFYGGRFNLYRRAYVANRDLMHELGPA